MKVRCVHCREYVDSNSALRVGLTSYCNDEHRKAHLTKPKVVTKKTSHKKPSSKKKSEPTTATKKYVANADRHCCRYCRGGYWLSQHHVRYRSEPGPTDHSQNNLLALCEEHHQLVHSDKKRFQPLCLAVLWMRETEGSSITIPEMERFLGSPKAS